jgi:transcriptional regulator with XRE-family HTH domain
MGLRQVVNRIAKEKKVSVASIARGIGMSSQRFNSYLNGNPRMDNLLKIAQALDVDPKILMIRNDYQPEAPNNEMKDDPVAFEKKQPNNTNYMSELQNLQEKFDLLKEVAESRKQKILTLEKELSQCQESNRVGAHT